MHRGVTELKKRLSGISDIRQQAKTEHNLAEVLIISLMAILCSANNIKAIYYFAVANDSWLKEFLALKGGIPSYHTIRRLFMLIDATVLDSTLFELIRKAVETGRADNDAKNGIHIDGKAIRGSASPSKGERAIIMVSAWASTYGACFGQVAVDKKSNEITAIPELLNILNLKNCVVTVDAMGCQKKVAGNIHDKGADYVLSLKGNHGQIHEEVETFFESEIDDKHSEFTIKSISTVEKDHGRIEERTYTLCDQITWIPDHNDWAGLSAIGAARSKRTIGSLSTVETRYFLTTLTDVSEFAEFTRKHWSIENNLHWSLDVCFREDACQVRDANTNNVFAGLRKMAKFIIDKDKKTKAGQEIRRLKAAWDPAYRLALLNCL
jgi:predicted transposase YbfD/YdcC